jgi:hypothetical protein
MHALTARHERLAAAADVAIKPSSPPPFLPYAHNQFIDLFSERKRRTNVPLRKAL